MILIWTVFFWSRIPGINGVICTERNINYPSNDLDAVRVSSLAECNKICKQNPKCVGSSLYKNWCFTKDLLDARDVFENIHSTPKYCIQDMSYNGDWILFGGHQYLIRSDEAVTKNKAHEVCSGLQSSLVSLETDEERSWLMSILHQIKHVVYGFYIGLEDQHSIQWISGASLTTTQWCPDEPNGDVIFTPAVIMSTYDGYCWKDISSFHLMGYICEREAPCSIPVPKAHMSIKESNRTYAK